MAREYGVNATSKALSLDFNKLKTHVNRKQTVKRRSSEAARTSVPQFLELVTAPHPGEAECVIELEGSRGKMRIEWKGSAAPDFAELSRMLWERE